MIPYFNEGDFEKVMFSFQKLIIRIRGRVLLMSNTWRLPITLSNRFDIMLKLDITQDNEKLLKPSPSWVFRVKQILFGFRKFLRQATKRSITLHCSFDVTSS